MLAIKRSQFNAATKGNTKSPSRHKDHAMGSGVLHALVQNRENTWMAGTSRPPHGKSSDGRVSTANGPLLAHVHQVREFEFSFGDGLWTDGDLLAVLPLKYEPGHC